MANRHKIRAYLYDNALTENTNDFVAKVVSERSVTIGDICRVSVARGGADISEAAMEHAVTLWMKEMAYMLCDGFSVNAGWFTANARIKGAFNSPSESFNPQKHSVVFDFVQGALLRKGLESLEVDILGLADSLLAIVQVTDVKTGSINDKLTPERILKINGQKLKIMGNSPEVGVFFIQIETEERYKVEPSDMVVNNPSELMVMIPPLPTGQYKVEVATQYSGSNLLKEPRTFVYDKLLTVQE